MNDSGARILDGWLLAHLDSGAWGQVIVRSVPEGHELRHMADATLDAPDLVRLRPADLREWTDTTATGVFRPLKSAPSLRQGWRCVVAGHDDLALALEGLYPGALGDWWAGHTGSGVATSFADFMGRQTGIYRSARNLSLADAEVVARACCSPVACIRNRRWTASTAASDVPPLPLAGDGIPCWEPCALLMDMARAAARISAATPVHVPVAAEDIPVLLAALETAGALPVPPDVRDADLSNPATPRRMRLLLERLRKDLGPVPEPGGA